jgi:hypothetical protein
LVAFATKPLLLPLAVRNHFTFGSAAESSTKSITSKVRKPDRAAENAIDVWAQLHTEDLPTLVARLRAAGFPPSMIRAIADAEVQQRYSPRLDELRRTLDETPYWRGDAGNFTGNSKLYEQMSQIGRERSKALRELIGQDVYAYAGANPTEIQRQRFGNIPPGKIDLVQSITDDYAEMTSQIRAGMQGVSLPEDKEKFALLEREKRADLAAILTPAELAEYEMRTSTITMRLRTGLTIMDASEAEFRAIYAAHQAHQETLYPTSPGGIMFLSSDTGDPRSKAYEQINSTLKQTLGADRFAQYQRANDREFQQLYQLTRPENTPYETLVRAYDSRMAASEASIKIANDASLNPEQKQGALKDLAQQSRTQILSTLGPTAGPTFAQSARWLSGLEQGRPFSVAPDGNIRSVPLVSPRPTPKP